MRILFFTDIHGSTKHLNEVVEKSRNADIIVCPGDLTIFENGLDEIFRKLNSIGKPVIVVHGNHESASSMAVLSLRYKNVHFIHKSHYIHEDVIFFGHGGGGFSTEDKSFDKVADTFIKEFNRITKKENKNFRLILVTHAPPYETAIDDMGGGWHVGCKNYKEFIIAQQPLIAVSGHIHETFEKEDKIGKTLMLNPGPKGRIIDI
jgi:Icc-related predicted phosphoesterase